MSREIIEAVQTIEREGIDEGTLVGALEDALLAAYKKTPGAARHAVVELDEEGEFRVFSIDIPKSSRSASSTKRASAIETSSGSRRRPASASTRSSTTTTSTSTGRRCRGGADPREDVTPDDFGRIAAQTAKQVILQRIREAERQMMYEEYIDRVGEVVTGIVQQAGDRNNVLVDLGKVESLLPRSSRSTASATSRARGSRQ